MSRPTVPPTPPMIVGSMSGSSAASFGGGDSGGGDGGGGGANGGGGGDGGSTFAPTEEWLAAWKARLPLRTIFTALDAMEPRVTREALLHGVPPNALKSISLTGVLPLPAPISVRRYAPNESSRTWLTQVIWGMIYSRNQELFDARAIRLVQILQVEDS